MKRIIWILSLLLINFGIVTIGYIDEKKKQKKREKLIKAYTTDDVLVYMNLYKFINWSKDFSNEELQLIIDNPNGHYDEFVVSASEALLKIREQGI